jgi:hypothetical protein
MTTTNKLNLLGLLLLGIMLLLGAFLYTAWQHSWVEYRLFASGPGGYKPTDQLPSAEDTTLLKRIFDDYQVTYKIVNHKLFVRRDSWMDKDNMGTCGLVFRNPNIFLNRSIHLPSD